MDKLFDYLVFLFIAYGIFSSYFKQMKKNAENKKNKEENETQNNYQEEEEPDFQDEMNVEDDEEARIDEQTSTNAPPTDSTNVNSAYDYDFDLNENINYQTNYNVKYTDAVKNNWLQNEVLHEMLTDKEKSEEYLRKQKVYSQNYYELFLANQLKFKLNNPSDFKEALLLAELINKPLSLR